MVQEIPVLRQPDVRSIRKWVIDSWDTKVTVKLVTDTINTVYFSPLEQLRLAKLPETKDKWIVGMKEAQLWYRIVKAVMSNKTIENDVQIDESHDFGDDRQGNLLLI